MENFKEYMNYSQNNLIYIKKKKLKLDGGGVSERNFIHIDDVSSATLKL